ncbi:MAG: S26 family signal peptidase [Caulobacteraceae bacterium]|nr:S26 family signal peptidase [Caulobacteraceae bacterium]
MKPSVLLIAAACVSAVVLIAAAELNRRDVVLFNATPSVPTGFYLRTETPVVKGAFVTVRAADVAGRYATLRQFTDTGDRFIKRVAAREGDRVCAEGERVSVGLRPHQGHARQRRTRTADMGRLPCFAGWRVLPDG